MSGEMVKPGYKETEVGVIPEDWDLRSISQLGIKFLNGGTPSTKIASYWKGLIPWITGADLVDQKIAFVRRYITVDAVKSSATNIIEKGNLLVATRTGVGKLAITEYDVAISQDLTGIYFDKNQVSTEYIFMFLDFRHDILIKLNQGTSIAGITRDTLAGIIIPLPPLPEQHAIAAALSDADGLIGALETLIAKKRAIKQAAMQQLLTGRMRLPGFAKSSGVKNTEVGVIPEDWEVLFIGKICTLYNGRAYALFEWEKTGVPVIRLQNLTGSSDYYYSRLNLPEHKYCIKGDLLYMWSATFGPHIWNGERAIYHYHIWKVVHRDELVNKMYLYYKLAEITEEKKTRAANGGTMLHVTKLSMESTLLALPPLPEQTAIATVLSDIDDEITALEERLEKTRQIKQGMMQQLLTGKVRLVTPQEAEAAA